jgi:divalent metal cation (Fe/Co/Zn/Cd) transporter
MTASGPVRAPGTARHRSPSACCWWWSVRLGAGSRELLIGRAAGDEQQRLIRTEIEATPGVDALVELLTMHLGPESLIVGARIDLDNDLSASDAEALADRIDSRLAQMLPVSPHVFLDPTRRSER